MRFSDKTIASCESANYKSFDFKKSPPNGIFYNRMSASAHSRGHRYAPENTKAVLLVHWGGFPIDLNKLKKIQDDFNNKFGFIFFKIGTRSKCIFFELLPNSSISPIITTASN